MVYFPRSLALTDASILDSRVDEAGLLALAGNKVVLGEPGMGKSALMRELARRLGVELVTAVRFINAKRPARLVPAGKPVLIDGLDEAMSRREGDAVDAIVAQLEEADLPPFILSCRSREWQTRGESSLLQLYGTDPKILTLEPFDRVEASTYLVALHPSVNADQVLDHLATHSLDDLYRNPLTLGLMGRVAESDANLPETRAVLFERACELVWPERDLDRQDTGLAQLTKDAALNAAGAVSAGLLFSGSEAVSAAGAGHAQQDDLRLADLEKLPAAEAARAIFSSKLFLSVGPLRATPIHRVIAEYLGAQWLAQQATAPRVQRRLLRQLHGSGGVPASLRGLHAWLAYHSPAMAEQVIAADPYGVLRYGETAALTPHQADCLFDALRLLAADDPYFRAADWDIKTAAGLMIPSLRPKIEAIIISAEGSAHLRFLLIEGLQGTSLAAELAHKLEAIVRSPERFHHERYYAAVALLPHRDRAWWQETIAALTDQCGEDSPRLARQLIERIDADVSDDLLVATLFAEMGVTSSPWPRRRERRAYTLRSYECLCDAIPSARLVRVLDLVADYAGLVPRTDSDNIREVAIITAHLTVRAIDGGMVSTEHASDVWRWLGALDGEGHYDSERWKTLTERLAAFDALRRAVQKYALQNDRRGNSLWATEHYMRGRLVGLTGRPGDIVCALDSLSEGDIDDPDLRQDWMDLVQIGWGPNGLDPEVRAAAEAIRRGDEQLADFLRQLENPEKPDRQVRWERNKAERARERREAS